MNTFLPCADYVKCARILDQERLSRQITECCQIAKILFAYSVLREHCGTVPWGIVFPPVIKLWTSNNGKILIPELHQYAKALNDQWKKDHGVDHGAFYSFSWNRFINREALPIKWPDSVHYSHRSRLLDKDYGYYLVAFGREGLAIPQDRVEYDWSNPWCLRATLSA